MSQRLALDSVAIRDERLFGWGWFLDDVAAAERVSLRIHGMDGTVLALRCPQGGARPDLAEAFPEVPHAAGGGFMLQARVPLAVDVAQVDVHILLADGREHVELLPELTRSLGLRTQGGAATIATHGRWRAFVHLLAAGQWSEALRRLRAWLARRVAPAQHMMVGDGACVAVPGMWVMFDHAMGGGANHFRDLKLAQWRAAGHRVVLVTPVLTTMEYEATGVGADGGETQRFPDLQMCLAALHPCAHVVINDLVSFDDPLLVVNWTLARRSEGSRVTYYLHDFHAACPSFTLTASDHRHCGIPTLDVCSACLPANDAPFLGMLRSFDVPGWRATWARLLTEADELIAFSAASVRLLERAFPTLDLTRVVVQAHSMDHLPQAVAPFTPDPGPVTTIGIVGSISAYKGAAIVKEMARLIERNRLPARLVVIGTLDGATPSPVLRITGPYQRGDLAGLLAKEGIGVAFLPSVVPETFSYVTAELMHHRVPLAVFDLGAPAERVRDYPIGRVISSIDASNALSELIELHRSLVAGAHIAGAT